MLVQKPHKYFLSYRRQDTKHCAGRLHDHLSAKFGDDNIVLDIESIPTGANFRDYIKNAISDCDVFLALIGEQWLSLIRNRSDLDQPDYVKIELEAALSSNLLVVPILVDDTEMPRETDLPAELQPLSSLNSIRLRYDHFASDVKTILQNIDRSLVIHQQGKIHDPVAAIAGAASHEEGFSGRFRLEVKSTDEETGLTWLCSETDYRDPRCLSVKILPEAGQGLTDMYGENPVAFFRGKTVIVEGVAQMVRIDFVSAGQPTGKFYFQTHVTVADPGQIQLGGR